MSLKANLFQVIAIMVSVIIAAVGWSFAAVNSVGQARVETCEKDIKVLEDTVSNSRVDLANMETRIIKYMGEQFEKFKKEITDIFKFYSRRKEND